MNRISEKTVIVIGGGIAGLTAAAILAHEGIPVVLLESHTQPGGCAGTFRRGSYIFDVGATQVAGFELGGMHQRIFKYLDVEPPDAEVLDLACSIDFCDGIKPIQMWHDPIQWEAECQAQFPGSNKFWSLCKYLHKSNWSFQAKDPILPPRSIWDFRELVKALRPITLTTSFLTTTTIFDLLKVTGCSSDKRLKLFLDWQLKLYSQEPSERTSALYGATVLNIFQKPHGLWHLNGSMQNLSNQLTHSLLRDGAKIYLGHRVVSLATEENTHTWSVKVRTSRDILYSINASDVVFTPPPQSLLSLISIKSKCSSNYLNMLKDLPKPTGAIVFYAVIIRSSLPSQFSGHFQFSNGIIGPLFLSISKEGDGRAPFGQATLIASAFTNIDEWIALKNTDYQIRKNEIMNEIIDSLTSYLDISKDAFLHQELSTPRSFAKWTGRPFGIVGGLGQNVKNFGPFSLPSRTPIKGLWLCGDSIYPGEGTAAVSQSAWMACRQLMKERGRDISLYD